MHPHRRAGGALSAPHELAEMDFVSDDNPNKERARVMLRVRGDIRRHLDELEPSGEPVNVGCATCHNGKPHPQTLEEALRERDHQEGGEAAVAYLLELRDAYYGSAAYDFTPQSVVRVANAFLTEENDTTVAEHLVELNLEHHPESAAALEGRADLHAVRGNAPAAIEVYERILERDPQNRRVRAKLQRLRR